MLPGWVWTLLWVLHYAAALVAIEYLLRRHREPRGMMAWILALLLLPFVGLLLFLLVGYVPIQRKIRRRKRRRALIRAALARHAASRQRDLALSPVDSRLEALIGVAARIAEETVTGGNAVTIYNEPEPTFLAKSLAIESATDHVHLEYYIFAADETGRAMADLLARKAREGVEVRLLLDAVGSWRMPRSFARDLRARGVRVAFFLPWGPSTRRFHVNCRNHRKLVVIDGRTGFLGSQNIGDEYLGRRKKFGPWRDTHLRVVGPAASRLQEVFVEDWHFAVGEMLSAERYFPQPRREGDHRVQIVPTGPDRRPDILHQLLFAAVSDARESVSLVTPYFVPDRSMLLALKSAAYRGVRVRLMLPSASDHWFVLWAGRASYEELIETGVEVYEYGHGMLHSKVVVVDGRWAMVGSANMDERSFRINFELTCALYDVGLAQELQTDFDAQRERARRITNEDVRGWSYRQTMAVGLARLASPLL